MSNFGCPKCGHYNTTDQQGCARYGVVFAKVKTQGASPMENVSSVVPTQALPNRDHRLRDLIFGVPEEVNNLLFWGRAAILVGMIVWGSQLMFVRIADNVAGESLLHLVNLPFHEAGHVVFSPLGSFIASLGGTLGQLLVPLVCMAALLFKTRDPFGASVCFWWFGENFLDIAPYVNDARAGELPLVGGNFGHSSPYGFHDWEYLLTESGLLRCDHVLAKVAHGIGSVLMILAVVWAGFLLYRQYQQRS